MRTYKRRAQECNEIEDVHELCRLCLDKTEVGFPIFRNEHDICAAISLRIMICVGLEMKKDDCLPNMICTNCYTELERYYKFRRKCETTYHKLKSHMLAIKYKECKNIKAMDDKDMLIDTKDSHMERKYSQMEHKHIQLEHKNIQIEQEYMQIEQSDIQIVHKTVEMETKDMEIKDVEKEIEQTVEDKLRIENQSVENAPEIAGKFHEQASVENENKALVILDSEEAQITTQTESNTSINIFLTSILTELGIIGAQEDKLILQEDSITSFELETGDDEHLVLELVEEDEDLESQNSEELQQDLLNIDNTMDAAVDKKSKILNHNKVKKIGEGAAARGRWCGACGRTFASRSAAARHARAHAAPRAHACPECRRTFAQRAVMERHRLVHRASRPFACPGCDKSFTQRGALAAHARSHAQPAARALALHRCALCDKVFLYASGLSRHTMTHSGRVYECSACDKQFNDRSSLLRHLKNFYHQNKHLKQT